MKKDVVILLDSITRLARAYNNVLPSVGQGAHRRRRRQRAAAPEALLRRGPQHRGRWQPDDHRHRADRHRQRMDEVIYEEFKGTGNCEIHLDRRMSEKRVYPSILLNKSGTRREELLLKPEILQKTWILRKLLYPMDEIEAMEFILDKMKSTKTTSTSST